MSCSGIFRFQVGRKAHCPGKYFTNCRGSMRSCSTPMTSQDRTSAQASNDSPAQHWATTCLTLAWLAQIYEGVQYMAYARFKGKRHLFLSSLPRRSNRHPPLASHRLGASPLHGLHRPQLLLDLLSQSHVASIAQHLQAILKMARSRKGKLCSKGS